MLVRPIFAALFAAALLPAQQAGLTSTGTVERDGEAHPYTVRHLPVAAFPELPALVAQALAARNCTIPQSYEAHGPENVIHGSLERAGSADWAVLCSAEGRVSLLVFFASAPERPVTLASVAETDRLDSRPGTEGLGFNWAIDPASPERVHQAQNGVSPRPPRPEHDAVADSRIERRTEYRYFTNGEWSVLPLAN